MMSLATALGIGRTARVAETAAGEAQPAQDGDFTAALTAAGGGASASDAAARILELLGQGTKPLDLEQLQDLRDLQELQQALATGLQLPAVPPPIAARAEVIDGQDPVPVDARAAGPQAAVLLAAGAGRSRQPQVPAPDEAPVAAPVVEGQLQAAGPAPEADAMREQQLLRQLGSVVKALLPETGPEWRPGQASLPLADSRALPGTELQPVTSGGGVTVQPASAPTTPTAAPPEQALRAMVGSPRWAEELGSRLVLLTARGQHEGALSLTPEHLGPLEVRISVHQNTAQVWFGAQHADTRAALAEAMPRLRELFAEAGLSLGQAGVSQEAPRRSRPETAAVDDPLRVEAEAARRVALPDSLRRIANALVDLYV
jgi:flagellar hook-length control protein FliK